MSDWPQIRQSELLASMDFLQMIRLNANKPGVAS
jgi:hypothetical protein